MTDKKYLVVSGDSFTAGHLIKPAGSWAHWVAKELDLELINLSEDGKGNEYISSVLLSWLIQNLDKIDDCIVMIGWTDMARKTIYHYDENDNLTTDVIVPHDLIEMSDGQSPVLQWAYENRKILSPLFSKIEWYLYETYKNILTTRIFLEKYNIPFLYFDAVSRNKCVIDGNIIKIPDIITPHDKDQKYIKFTLSPNTLLESIVSNNIVDYLYDEKYITFGGYSIFEWLHFTDLNLYSKGNEGHTNELGAHEISKIIVKYFSELYGG